MTGRAIERRPARFELADGRTSQNSIRHAICDVAVRTSSRFHEPTGQDGVRRFQRCVRPTQSDRPPEARTSTEVAAVVG